MSDPSIPAGLEENTEDLYENAPCGYLSTSADGTIVRVNATFVRMAGYDRDALVGVKRFADLLTPGGRIYTETHLAPLLRMQGFAREIALEIVRADGTRLPVLITSVLHAGAAGGSDVIRTMVFDATERRRYEEELLRERKRAQDSEARARLLARTLQESIVPPEPSQIPGLEVAAVYRPAGEGETVGGDFYDVFRTLRGDWAVVIGDVAGKGVEAARVTAAARYTLRATAMRSNRPTVLLRALNETLLAQRLDLHCTVAYARIGVSGDGVKMTLATGGHPLPIFVDRDGNVAPVGQPGTLIGAFDDLDVEDVVLGLPLGSSVVFYTDGVTEARDPDGLMFGDERLLATVSRNAGTPASRICNAVAEAALEFQRGPGRDDIAVLVVRRPD